MPLEGEKKLNVLVMGSGAREHAIADSILKSTLLNKLFLADANDGFKELGEKIEYKNFDDLAKKCSDKKIDIAIFGSEESLCEGIVDVFKEYKINCIGVNKEYSTLESSKLVAKLFIGKHGIKTADFTVASADSKVKDLPLSSYPLVIKANGLCKGKGVKIVHSENEALQTMASYLSGKFGESGKIMLLEEFLEGEELSLMSLWDGNVLLHFPTARDFKKLNKNTNSPNTGGMGAFCPVLLSNEQEEKLFEYKNKLQKALALEKADFVGFIYSGLIWAKGDWHVLEYNVRLGDPETQVLLTYLETDFLLILKKAVDKKLCEFIPNSIDNSLKLEYKSEPSACLVVATEGYPEAPKDGEKINIPNSREIKIFYAGVKKEGKNIYSKGGRILSLCTNGKNSFDKLKSFAKKIQMKNKYFREDLFF